MPKKKRKPVKKETTDEPATETPTIKKKGAKKKAKTKKPAVKKPTKKPAVKKTTKKSDAVIEVSDEDEIEAEEEDIEFEEGSATAPKRAKDIHHGFIPIPRIWPDHLTKYERSRIIGARALQISMGAPILVEELEKIGNPVEVAEKELEYSILPLTIRRIFPDGTIIDIALHDLLQNE